MCFRVQLAWGRRSILSSLLAGSGSIHLGLKLRRAVCDGRGNRNTRAAFLRRRQKTGLAISPPRGSRWLAYPLFDNCCVLVAVGSLPSVSSTKGLGHLSTTFRLGYHIIRSFRSLDVLVRTPKSHCRSLNLPSLRLHF
ncbi:hypothetical protein BJX65DRAFT_233426 [Aspergillus insuetus]